MTPLEMALAGVSTGLGLLSLALGLKLRGKAPPSGKALRDAGRDMRRTTPYSVPGKPAPTEERKP